MGKRTFIRSCFISVFIICMSFYFAIPAFASNILFSAPETAPASSPPSSSAPPVSAGGIEVTEYQILDFSNNPNGEIPKQITNGMSVTLYLRIFDERTIVKGGNIENESISANVNTSSFTLPSGGSITANGFSVIGDGVGYNLAIPLTYTGTGNTFQCDIFYNNRPDIPVYPFTLTLNQCVPKVDTPSTITPSSETSTVTRGTGFVLTSASFGDAEVVAGKEFSLDLSMLATNGAYRIENAVATLVPPKEIRFASGSSIAYIGNVAPNQTVKTSFALLPSATAEEGSYTITIKMKGISAQDGSTVEASADITVPLIQPERFEISSVTVPDYLTVGGQDGAGYGSINLVNKGKGSVFNVEVAVVGKGLSFEEGKNFIGTIAGGAQNSADFNIIAAEAGELKGKLVVTYENARGDIKELVHEFAITADDMGGGMEPMEPFPIEPIPEETGGFPRWVFVLLGLVILAIAAVVVTILLKKRKAKKQAAIEDEEDEDI